MSRKNLSLWLIQCADWFTGTSSSGDHLLMIDIPRSAKQSRRPVRPLELCHQSRRSLEHTRLARWQISTLKHLSILIFSRGLHPHLLLLSVNLHQGGMDHSHPHPTPHRSRLPRSHAIKPTRPLTLPVDGRLRMTRAISHRPGLLMKMSVHHLWSGIRLNIESLAPIHPKRLHPSLWVEVHSTDIRTLHYDTRTHRYDPCRSIFPLRPHTSP
jgi:hypothetical protein